MCLSTPYRSPFFGEEFGFLVPRDFRQLSFYVMANDCLPLSRDAKIGKVAIYKDALITVCVYFMLCVVDVLYVVVMCSNCILTYSIYVEIRCFLTLHYILVYTMSCLSVT